MASPELAERIRGLIAEGYTRAQIAKIIGCRRSVIEETVGLVRPRGLSATRGSKVKKPTKTPHPDPDGEKSWCSGCGALVVKPCLKCYLIKNGYCRQ